MSGAVAIDEGRVLAGPDDAHAFFDADWVPRQAGPVPALLVADGELRASWGGPGVAIGTLAAADAVALALAAAAQEVADVVSDVPGSVEVLGSGAVARLVRELVADTARSDADRPAAIVDCSGDPEAIAAAAERVDDLGTLVLAGPPPGDPLTLDLYPDVHVRGLRLVGAPPPLAEGAPITEGPLPERLRSSLRTLDTRELPANGAAWYELPAAATGKAL